MALVRGELVGIPTRGPEVEEAGFNQLRPIALGRDLIADAEAGESYVQATGVVAGTNQQTFELEKWSTGFDGTSGCGSDDVSGYPEGSNRIIAQFRYSGMTDGEDFLEFWVDPDDNTGMFPGIWNWGAEGNCYTAWLSDQEGFTKGKYIVAMFAGPNLRRAGVASVEVGVEESDATRITATAIDGDTGRPIQGAVLAFLRPDVSIDEWRANPTEEGILASGETGADGTVDLGPRFEPGVSYPALGFADGYASIYASYQVPTDAGESIGVTFTFSRPAGG
jgi:hypothetical protein